MQSQPPAAIAPAPTATAATAAPRSTASSPEKPNGAAAARPTSAPAKPAAPPTVVAAAARPTTRPSPAANGAATAASPVAVIATSVAGLPGAVASPAVSTDARANAQPDILGVATSAVAVAEANATDQEAVALCGPGAVLATRAGQLAGKQATIAIPRVAASYQPNTRGQPTFLNDAPYPNHVFTAVIWGTDRRQFQPPPESWQGRSLCVTGPVELFQQRPQIAVSSPSQLRAAR
ncbi:MAG: hypothetical protein IT306_02185 [Chloroflexi bacterium]|nr:hypothetical protein [Chloroflexota bacterium]